MSSSPPAPEPATSHVRDCALVLEAMTRSDLAPPSHFDLGEAIAAVERAGRPAPAVLAWLLKGNDDAEDLVAHIRQAAADLGLLRTSGAAALAVLVERDLEILAAAHAETWERPDELIDVVSITMLLEGAQAREKREGREKWGLVLARLHRTAVGAQRTGRPSRPQATDPKPIVE
jgi:hypothetical protein